MAERDPRCIITVSDPGAAGSLVAWLDEQGIPAEARPGESSGLDGIGALAGFSNATVEVWVNDPGHAEEAIRLLTEHAQRLQEKNTQPVLVVCEECGQTGTFPGNERGTVQTCPHCGKFIDVIGEEDWDEYEDYPEGEVEEEEV